VSKAEASVRRLLAEDAALYREIRLEALQDAPEWFGSTFAEESARPLPGFADRLRHSAVFGAFDGEELIGIAAFFGRQSRKEAHKGVLVGMYVRPQARGCGIGRHLVEAVIGHARRHVEILQLTVVKDNEPARRLYTRLGFIEYGIEKNSLKYNGRYWDEVLMAMPLSSKETPRP
jgi:RimJ/RimL family protein N-acetyltransferase